MQCWVTVKVTRRKYPIFEWSGRGGVWIVLFPEVATFENSVSKIFWSPKRSMSYLPQESCLTRTGVPTASFLHRPPPHCLLSNSATSKWPMCYLPPLPYTDRATLRLPYPPYPTNWSLAPQPQNGRRATFLRSLTWTGGSLILPSPLYPTTCSQTSHH